MRAAIVWEADKGFEVRDDVRRRGPGPGELVVRVRATGVCQTDVRLAAGAFGQVMPAVLGHEAAGEVIEVGDAVRTVAVGDHVVVTWVPPCGRCFFCVRGDTQLCAERRSSRDRTGGASAVDLEVDGTAVVAGMGTATFAEECVVSENGVVPIPRDLPFPIAAMLGCAVPTGVGAALRAARVQPGDAVLVVGCGAVGLNAIQGAAIAGAAVIVGVDPTPARRESAIALGATAVSDPTSTAELVAHTGGIGFDVAIDAVGAPATIRAAWDAVRRGGKTVVVGAGKREEEVRFSAYELFHDDKQLIGSFYGSINMHRDLPLLIKLWRSGKLDVESLMAAEAALEDINEVVAMQQTGEVIRRVIVL